MSTRRIVRTTAATGIALIALGLAGAGTAAAAGDPQVQADLDGNGTPETVTTALVGDNDQLVSTTINGVYTSIHVPGDSFAGVQPARVVDLNGDGRQELVVTQSVGANTTTFSALDYDGRNLRPIVGPDSTPFTFFEGGGIAAHSGYNCSPQEGGRVFGVVGSTADNVGAPGDELTYTGQRTVYTLRDGALSVQDEAPFAARPVTDPLLVANPTTCA